MRAPLSRVQITRSGLRISMSCPVSIAPARTSPGPEARRRTRFGPSPCMRRPMLLTLRTTSVTSSSTPGSDENSCRTPSICIEVIAAPCNEESSTRRSALPRVKPKPRSSGSAVTVATRVASSPGSTDNALGLIRVCQFFCSTRTSVGKSGVCPRQIAGGLAAGVILYNARCQPDLVGRRVAASDAAAFRRAAAVMRDRRHVTDRGDREPDRLQRAQGGFPAGTWAFHLDVEGTHAMLHGLAPGILGGDLRRIRRRFARTLEPLAARGRPRDRVALGIGDRDHRVVEGRRDMRGARSDVLALASPQTRCCCRLRHLALPLLHARQVAPYFFLPAIGRAGPLRVRALVCVLWPRTGKPLR